MWLFSYFLKKSTEAALTARLLLKSKSSQYSFKEGVLKTYCKVVNHLLETYTTEEFISEKDRIACFVKPSNMSPLKIANELWPKRRRCSHVYEECVLKGIFVEELPQSIRPSMRS